MSIFKSAFFKKAVLKGLAWGGAFALAYSLDCFAPPLNGIHYLDIALRSGCFYLSARLLYLQIQMIEVCRELESF